MAPPPHQLQNLIGDFPVFKDMVMGSALACLKLACFSKICIPARRNIFNWNSCLVWLLMRFPASWKLLVGLPAFGFCFDYICTTSTSIVESRTIPQYRESSAMDVHGDGWKIYSGIRRHVSDSRP